MVYSYSMPETQQRFSVISDLVGLNKLIGAPIGDSPEPCGYEATPDHIRHWPHGILDVASSYKLDRR
jgi:hypothetical protein